MATCMTVICLITTKETSDKGYLNGSAMYRSNKKNYKRFDFRLFNNLKNKDIHSFDEGDIVTLTGKFCFRNDFDGDNPLFISVSQAITYPRSKKFEWNRDNMPIAHPYVTSTVYLNSNPLAKYNNHEIIKSKSDKVYCSYNKKKYDHDFYLYYDEEGTRWTRTINSIKKGNMRVHISGFYVGSNEDDNSTLFHGIQLTELDFESKSNNFMNDDDDDEFFFGNSSSKRKKSKFSSDKGKKHQISLLSENESSEPSDESRFFKTSTKDKKKHKKDIEKSKSKVESNESTTLTKSLSYNDLSFNKTNQQLNKDDDLYDSLQEDNSQKIEKHDSNKTKSTKLAVKNEEQNKDDDLFRLSNNKKKSNKNMHASKKKDKNQIANKATNSRVLRSNQKRKGILDIAVEKIIEVSDEDSMQNDKTESFSMDIDD